MTLSSIPNTHSPHKKISLLKSRGRQVTISNDFHKTLFYKILVLIIHYTRNTHKCHTRKKILPESGPPRKLSISEKYRNIIRELPTYPQTHSTVRRHVTQQQFNLSDDANLLLKFNMTAAATLPRPAWLLS